MESGERAHILITQMLELLRELSYETRRQDETIEELRAQLEAGSAESSGSGQGAETF